MSDGIAPFTPDPERAAFYTAYSEWLDARAALFRPYPSELSGKEQDELTDRRNDERIRAEAAFAAVRSPSLAFVYHKLELVEDLATDDRTSGRAAYPLLLLAIASLKADLLYVGREK